MKTSELHTLKSILTEGIRVEGQETPVKISYIYIPKIQRAYAQGRNSEADIRKDFLNVIFETLVSEEDTDIELSFLFGSQQMIAKRKGIGFELLDGQQRVTTLFLLYWYVNLKEKNNVPDFLSMFTYDTRDTSAQFLQKITSHNSRITIADSKPSDAIKNNKWFTDEYYCDPTVCAMLNMLDDIDKQYNGRKCSGVLERLERLRFYVLMLERFDMNDELYIKMNSRGLSLIPFENFKASIVKFMKSKERNGLYGTDDVVDGQSPYWFDFTAKMDAKWIDLFWKYEDSSTDECKDIIEIDDKRIGVRYFNFINRYLFTKSCISDPIKDSKLNPQSSFFYQNRETDKMTRLSGWEYYEIIFSSQDLFRKLEKVLDELFLNWDSIKKLINDDPYDNIKEFDILNDSISSHQSVVFAALTEFIERIPDGMSINTKVVEENFKRMLRVVFNIIENTTIESEVPVARVIKAVSEIISAQGAITDNFYRSLSSNTFDSRNQQLQEEIVKAKEMFSNERNEFDSSWEAAFVEAEKHPFYKGSVLFFFTPNIGNSDDFLKRYNVIKELFDANGIAEHYRENHVLIRAIISQINYWNKGLSGRYITEVAEKEKYLKILLTSYPAVRTMLCNYFDNKIGTTVVAYLNEIINSATPENNESKEFNLLFNRLVKDPTSIALFDWIREREKEVGRNKHFCIQNNRSYLINIPGAWYDRMILDTERHLIIPNLVEDFKNYEMTYEDDRQKEMMNGPIKDTTGWSIKISMIIKAKSEKQYKLLLQFNEWKKVEFLIFGGNTDNLAQLFNVSPENKGADFVRVIQMPYQLKDCIDNIKKEIESICEKLESLRLDF